MVAELIQFKQPESKEPKEKVKGGVITKPNSNNLYIDIYPYGERFQTSSGLPNTPENRERLQKWVDGLKDKLEEGTFVFAEAFPNASEKKKAFYALIEGRTYKPEADSMLFNQYIDLWVQRNLTNAPPQKVMDYSVAIRYWIRPFFGSMLFSEITGVTAREFIKQLNHKKGKKIGQPLSSSRVNVILMILRAIWYDAVEEYQWTRTDPFAYIRRYLAKDKLTRPKAVEPQVFRFDEWQAIEEAIHPYYKPMLGLMVRTGMSMSEIAGLKKSSITQDYLHIENSIVKGYEKTQLKNKYRTRKAPMTKKIKEMLDLAVLQNDTEYVFRNMYGNEPKPGTFSPGVWKTALKKAGVPYRVPYTMRHTFAAWSLALGMHPNRLVKLMGHNSKKMVYEVYGNYVEGLEGDTNKIREYFGYDFK